MAVKLATAMNVDRITILSRNDKKKADAEKLGCEILVYTDEEAVAKAARSFDVVLDKVSVPHDVAQLASTLKVGGHWVLLGGVAQPFSISAFCAPHESTLHRGIAHWKCTGNTRNA